MPGIKEERSISELFTDFTNEIKTLFRDEIELFRIEISHKMSESGRHAGLIAAGGVVLCAGLLTLIAAAVAALSLVLQVWLAAAIVGVALSAIGSLLVKKNLNDLKRADFKPKRTLESIREIKEGNG